MCLVCVCVCVFKSPCVKPLTVLYVGGTDRVHTSLPFLSDTAASDKVRENYLLGAY